jgi:hypothetical protein
MDELKGFPEQSPQDISNHDKDATPQVLIVGAGTFLGKVVDVESSFANT